MADIKKEVEAILFASGRVVLVKEFQSLLRVKDAGVIVEAVKDLMREYEERDSPMMIVEEEDGWKLTVRERYLPVVHTINPHTELSKSVLETLAVIAWKQPMLQSNVIKIRTNKAYDHISELVSLGFITREKYGRSYLIKVTQKFLDYFDLPEPKAIKDMFKDFKDIEVAVKKKVGDSDKPKTAGGAGAEEGAPLLSPEIEEVPAEGMDLDTFVDELPPMETPKTERDVETYDDDSPGVVREIEETPEEQKLEEEKLEEAEAALEKAEHEEESPEDKAKRLAKEVLGEEQEAEKEEEEREERKLHPKLEEFLQAEHEEAEKEAKEEHSEEEQEELETQESEEHEEPEEPGTEEGAGEGPASDEEGGAKQAEEYPGQFSEQAGEEGSEEDTDEKM
ncbi:SMC-Scp complex subunit ScpB [Candidatus Woesearchaeota archaeon]|nr:SMC-Scp complex subunit ScpB [Candidatus Woesearchaeota archaeon]